MRERPVAPEPAKTQDVPEGRQKDQKDQDESRERKDARKDAQEHFWNWANDIASSKPRPMTPDERVPWGRSKTGPDFPAPSFTKISDTEEREEYFTHFADELRQSVGEALPGSVEPMENVPPPPPKRAARPALPPPPPPIEGKAPAPPIVDFVPPMVNAHRIQVLKFV